ncbi:MAG: carboxy terminal-processing peptidase [Bacteroidia bacterium]|nr:carboxy terminal-processing peptidase [Bacteroidia bacterium]
MSRIKFIKALTITVCLGLVSFTTYKLSFSKNQLILDILMSGLNNAHYAPLKIDDEFSKKAFDLYLKRLDYNKKFLLQSDIDEMAAFRDKIDDEISNGTFQLFNISQQLIVKRIAEKEALYKELLSKPFDYKVNEEYETDVEKTAFAKTDEDLKKEWRKSLQYQVLIRLNEDLNTQEKAKEVAAKKDSVITILSFDSIEAKARRKVMKVNDDWFKRLKKYNDKDRFSAYVNCITAMYDPHTEFFPPKEKKQFDQSMSGQLEGIGAKLQQKDGLVKITEIVVGSPSYKQGELKAGDAIIKVAQGAAEPVDIVDMDLDDAIELIKGKKGTEVRLTVKKPDGAVTIIPIIRDIIMLEETFAQSAVLQNGKQKIGYIRLPVFYSDFTKNGAKRCGADIKTEAVKLKNAGVDGIIIDLRDNGGGSLQEVIDMVGHFIPTGPTVQVRKKGGKADIYSDHNPEQVYDGPMAVLVNRNSASASEIFAAAMQDYKRALIVGTQSFGKGTVQQFLDLDNYLMPEFDTVKPLGAVKVTMQKFYRINGGATQLKGVMPDVVLPDAYSQLETGEKELDFPMSWDEIPSAEYKTFNYLDYDKIRKKSKERVKANKTFALVEEESNYFKSRKDDSKYSLNLDKFREEEKKIKAENKKYENLRSEIKGFEASLLKVDIDNMQNDTTKMTREKKWAENLQKDFYIYETVNMLGDTK